jgi:hypothetical protein
MGAFTSHSAVTKSLEKNQQYINEMNKLKVNMINNNYTRLCFHVYIINNQFLNQLERWIQMQAQMKQRERAQEIAKNRELFIWMSAFYLVAGSGIMSK